MGNSNNGRVLVNEFLYKNQVTDYDLAAMYGKTRQWIRQVLDGKVSGPSANKLVLEIIRDFKIRGE